MVKEIQGAVQNAGAALLRRLDGEDFGVQAAMWVRESSYSVWRLLVAVDEAGTRGPTYVYSTIRRTLKSDPQLSDNIELDDVRVVSPRDPMVRSIKTAVPHKPSGVLTYHVIVPHHGGADLEGCCYRVG